MIQASTLLNSRAATTRPSAVRDLLEQAARPGMISLAGGLPDAEEFPLPELADIAAAVVRTRGRSALQYGVTAGEAETRQAFTVLFRDLPEIDADDLLITTGSQQGLDLIARVLLDPGDVVIVGQVDYLGALQALGGSEPRFEPIPIDDDGLQVDVLTRRIRSGLRPKACYLVPHFHNPTGATISAERRTALHELSSRYGFVVIEDDPYRQLHYRRATGEDTSPTEATNADPELTVRLRSTSKILTPGLRLGAAAGPRWLCEAMVIEKQAVDLHTSTLTQAIAADALTAPWLDGHVARLRATYRAKRDVLAAALNDQLGERIRFRVPDGGMFFWAEVGRPAQDDIAPTGGPESDIDTGRLLAAALDVGVCFVPGQAFSTTGDHRSHLRLSFVTACEAELVEAVERLDAVLGG